MKRRAISIAALLTAVVLSAGLAQAAFRQPAELPAAQNGIALPAFLGFGKDEAKPKDTGPATHPIKDEETFVKGTKAFSIMPFSKAQMAFTISLPEDWETMSVASDTSLGITTKILTEVASFRSPFFGMHRAEVSIHAIQMEHGMSAANWLKNHLLSNSYTPEGDIAAKNVREASGTYIYNFEGKTYHVYTRVQVSGDILMLARFEAPVQVKDYLAFLQKRATDSFSMIHIKETPIEEMKGFSVVDAVKFQYPASWEITSNNFSDMNNLYVQLVSKSGSGLVQGYVRVHAIRRSRQTTLKMELDKLKEFLRRDMRFLMKTMHKSGPSEAADRFIFNRYEIYDAESTNKKGAAQELHLVVLGDEQWYVTFFMVTPREQDNLYVWSRNTYAFGEMVKSLR